MDSPQSVVSPLKSSFAESEKHQSDLYAEEPSLGALKVFIHQARDIHNICIYQKQDVYAKLCLTSDPGTTVSTKIINGGGANPVFNENLSLHVRKVDSSLKCEIWMLSRVKNYLEDQLLGFTLLPLSEIFLHNGKLEKEFSLSSTDLFHSPAGFVQLSVSYIGAAPDVIPIPAQPASVETGSVAKDSESIKSVPEDMDKLEFPDPKVVNENNQMVEEYFGMPCTNVDSPSSDSLVSSDTEYQVSSEVDNLRTGNSGPSPKIDSPRSSASTNGTSSASARASLQSFESTKDSKSPNEELVAPPKDKSKETGDTVVKPVVTVNIEPESKVVQQDIVDMYMKSMQQFTESLAKMKLPMDLENGPTSSENSTTSQQKTPGSKNSGSRVFYGSRAFF